MKSITHLAALVLSLSLGLGPSTLWAEDPLSCEQVQEAACKICGAEAQLCTSLTPEVLAEGEKQTCTNARKLLDVVSIAAADGKDTAPLCEHALALGPASSDARRAIDKVFAQKRKTISSCYKRITQKHGDLEGKITVILTIGTDGVAQKGSAVHDEVGKGLAKCVTAKLKKWKFPKLEHNTTVRKTWDFSSRSVREVQE